MRTFKDSLAVRENVPVIMGLVGSTGSGKTGSMLELLHGFQDVYGGDIGVIDTEARRSLHYADAPLFSDPTRKFKFHHLPFEAPFPPLDYQEAVEHFISKGVKNIGIDSASHLHEGPGGTLDAHEKEVERISKAWSCSGDKANLPAWNKPKRELTMFINYIKQKQVNFVFCFRAKEKMKMMKVDGRDKPVEAGWQPIGSDELFFEMMVACLLLPESDGQPIWNKKEEKGVKALPSQFRDLFSTNPRLSAAVGRKIAEWAQGGHTAPSVSQPVQSTVPPAAPAPASQTAKVEAQQARVLSIVAKRLESDLRCSKTIAELVQAHSLIVAEKKNLSKTELDHLSAVKDEVKEWINSSNQPKEEM